VQVAIDIDIDDGQAAVKVGLGDIQNLACTVPGALAETS